MKWTIAELAYLGGIIDADGCVNIYRGGKRPRKDYNVRIYVVNTNPDLIQWLTDHFGGMSYTRSTPKGWKTKYEWVVERRVFDAIAEAVLPHMVIKARQMRLALDFRASFATRYRTLPAEVRVFRESCFHQMKSLNTRGD